MCEVTRANNDEIGVARCCHCNDRLRWDSRDDLIFRIGTKVLGYRLRLLESLSRDGEPPAEATLVEGLSKRSPRGR
jgi:hypothetical protein